MSVNKIDKSTGNASLIAGGTLWADSPVGTILPFGGATAPSGWLLCQGQEVSRTTYSELFAVIGTAFGSGDGSTTFNLPDMREVVPVGAGTSNRSAITDHDAYSLGQFKDDQLQEHSHYAVTGSSTAGTEDWTQFASSHIESYTGARVRGVYTDARKGTTTHGKQLGVNYIIKAKMIGVPADFLAKVDEAVSEAMIIKHGHWTGSITLQKIGDSQNRDRFSIPVTFDTPMPDDNYIVVIDDFDTRYTTIMSRDRTATGFNITGANTDNNATSTLTSVRWTAIRFPS